MADGGRIEFRLWFRNQRRLVAAPGLGSHVLKRSEMLKNKEIKT